MYKLSELKNTSNLILTGDGGHKNENGGTAYMMTIATDNAERTPWGRHNGGGKANFLWVDGHVQSRNDWFSISRDNSSKLFNADSPYKGMPTTNYPY